MAGPLSTEEIEDVVTSVRRLVSNEQSSRRASRDLAGERLLLTPALRVVSETSPLAPLILEAQDEKPAEDPAPAMTSATEVVLDVAGTAELIEAEWEDEAIWTSADPVPLGEVALAADEAEVLLPTAVEDMGQASEGPDPVALAEDVEPDPFAEEPVAFVPLRRRADAQTARPLADAAPEPAPEAELTLPDTDDAAPIVEQAEETPVADMVLDAAAASDPVPGEAPQTLFAEPAALSHRMPTEIVDADGTPLAVVDEAALQEIVRQMIREELQGDLGERITRNVRKLVRAEINRALIARDLD